MEISDIVYLAFATVLVIVVLHIGVFWVSRLIQAPKPKIVYVDRPVAPVSAPIAIVPEVVSAPLLPVPPREMPPQKATVPTYDMPPPIVQSNKPDPSGPPAPLETRNVDRVGFAGEKGG